MVTDAWGAVWGHENLHIVDGSLHVTNGGVNPVLTIMALAYRVSQHVIDTIAGRLGEPRASAAVLRPGETLNVSVPVTNTGARAGQAVVQLYVRDVEAAVQRPAKELKAFAKLTLEPGATGEAALTLDMRSLAYYDEARQAWVADAGDFELLIGTSSTDLPRTLRVQLIAEWSQAADAGSNVALVARQ